MTRVQCVPIAQQLVDEGRLNLAADFQPGHTDFCFAPDGGLYVLTHLFYNHYRYDKSNNTDFSAYIVTKYDRDLRPGTQAAFVDFYRMLEGGNLLRSDALQLSLCVLPDGAVVLSTPGNRTFLYDADLRQRLGAFAEWGRREDRSPMYRANFAHRIRLTPEGRLLCTLGEVGVHLARPTDNFVAVSDGLLTATHRPTLTCVGCLKPDVRWSAPAGFAFAYLRHADGRPVSTEDRPRPALPDLAREKYGLSLYDPRIHDVLPLSGGRCLVTLLHKLLRGGTKGCDFLFGILSSDGRLVGRLEGIDSDEESPYVGHHYEVAVDHVRGRILYLGATGFFVFDEAGALVRKIRLDDGELKFIRNLELCGCSPAGEVVLVHPEQHLFMLVPAGDTVNGFERALRDSVGVYKKERGRLKKARRQVKYRWIHDGEYVRH